MEELEQYILVEEIGWQKTKWYVVDYELYNHPESDWVLCDTISQSPRNAIRFINKLKAERIARILNEQQDEEGGISNFKVVKIRKDSQNGCDAERY